MHPGALAWMLLASSGDVALRWDAPIGCPDHASALAEIRARLGDRSGAAMEADVQVVRDGADAYVVEIELRGDVVGTRSLRASSCTEALTATATVIAIAATAPPPPREDAEVPEPPPPIPDDGTAIEAEVATREPSPSTPRHPASPDGHGPPPPSRRRARPALTVAARAGLDVGTVPRLAPLLTASLGALGPRWHAVAGVSHRFAAEVDVATPNDVALGGRFRVTAGHLVAGPRLRWGTFELPLRAGLELGVVSAQGVGAVIPHLIRRTWSAVVLGAAAAWVPRRAIALQLGVDAIVPLWRPRFVLGETIGVATVAPAAVRAWLGLELRFSFDERGGAGKGTRRR